MSTDVTREPRDLVATWLHERECTGGYDTCDGGPGLDQYAAADALLKLLGQQAATAYQRGRLDLAEELAEIQRTYGVVEQTGRQVRP